MIADDLELSHLPPEGETLDSGNLLIVGLAAATRFALPYVKLDSEPPHQRAIATALQHLWACAEGELPPEQLGADMAALDAAVVDDDDIAEARDIQFYTNDVADVLAYLCGFAQDASQREAVNYCLARIQESLALYAEQSGEAAGSALATDEMDRRLQDIANLRHAPATPALARELRERAERHAMTPLLELYV
jgi:hypothetical protein